MLLRIIGAIIGFILMVLSIAGLIRTEDPVNDSAWVPEASETDLITFGTDGPGSQDGTSRRYSIDIPGIKLIGGYEEDGESTIIGFNEVSEQAFILQRITTAETLTLDRLEDICRDCLEDVAFHAAGDLVYLTGYDAEHETDVCVFTGPGNVEEGTTVYVIGLNKTTEELPAARYFQTLTDHE